MNQTELVLLSGFLGAGKTTLMLAAAEMLKAKGLKVACITNDQGEQLVDSKLVLLKELPMQQIQGGCLCCRFDDLLDAVNRIIAEIAPDLILAEAVGSCTDLVSTVIKPLKTLHKEKLQVRPLSIVTDHRRLSEHLQQETSFTKEISYIYQKQLEEGQCIVLNKTDLISNEELVQLEEHLGLAFPFAEVLPVSAIRMDGVRQWVEYILRSDPESLPILDIDYDIYADGEAQLGWLNASFRVEGSEIDPGFICSLLVDRLVSKFKNEKTEMAHLKIWAQDGNQSLKISATHNHYSPSIDHVASTGWKADRLAIWVNARINIDPLRLQDIFSYELARLQANIGVKVVIEKMDCFAPSRPVPTHRM